MINGKVYSCEGCYGTILFPEFSVNSIYLEVGDFDYIHFFKPIKQSLVPYIIFDLPKGHNCSCLEVIFENRPNIHFAILSDIHEWVLFRCNLCSTIEISLHTLEYQLSNYIKSLSVIKTREYLYYQGSDMSGLMGIKDLYYFRKWISTLGLKIDTEILWGVMKNLVGHETIN